MEKIGLFLAEKLSSRPFKTSPVWSHCREMAQSISEDTHKVCSVDCHSQGKLLVRVDLFHKDVPVVPWEVDLGCLVSNGNRFLGDPDINGNASDVSLKKYYFYYCRWRFSLNIFNVGIKHATIYTSLAAIQNIKKYNQQIFNKHNY